MERPATGSFGIRVLFVSLRADFGGGPEHLWQLLRHLPEDFEACVACPADYPYHGRYCSLVGEANVFVLPHRAFRCASLFGLARFCREHGIAVLHSHGKGAGLYTRLLALLTGLACVHTFHGVHMKEYGPLKRWLYRIAEKGMSLLTRAGVAVSRGERAQILEEGLMPEARLRLIENGVAVPEVPVSLPAVPPYRVVSISRFGMQKHSEFLVDILEALQRDGRLGDFHVVVVGDGPGREVVEALARARHLDDALECAGAMPEPQALFAGALCYISTSRWEGMPLAVLEAMAHGLPPVVTDVVGNRDVVIHGMTGLLYPEHDARAAANALLRLADDTALRAALAVGARNHVLEHHDVRLMADATYALLRRVAGGGERGAG
ncbi:glycosyltransferase family 4 protein [Nitratidesulfovibrio termitidis]|uniref:glycosyltransferase family 4 protein n=1 Tax=Nitratidesulfovibrio termitidis TaxID=42252 RepID=UPI00042237B5|nr:glycosyltransferase family 4 protein [Nitratidesulfovibrio termitidis]